MTCPTLNVYDRARLVLHDRGWTQADLTDRSGGVCILGACLIADGIDLADALARGNLEDEALVRHASFLAPLIPQRRRHGFTPVEIVSLWNDEADRTVADVDEVLAVAAEHLRLADRIGQVRDELAREAVPV